MQAEKQAQKTDKNRQKGTKPIKSNQKVKKAASFDLPILTFLGPIGLGASARAVLTLQKPRKTRFETFSTMTYVRGLQRKWFQLPTPPTRQPILVQHAAAALGKA